ncbi:trehalase family glycosidase [Ferruginibacter sp. HRS2-29]|uniref:alpha-L-rhamnosidase-related protein n=1 Tax=Ferruginibacter sp. HRS2-29 TaxID=2487334 RepID=UPI0020CB6A90|nr:trehalase family glycosidase [Ferruginibacter sp. HRS2-29]MCP9750998.1 glycogen debranching protein [Ferruginibacter sp. HRS2-29]
MKRLLSLCLLSISAITSFAQQPIFQSPAFSIYPDKVVQGKYEAKALSATQLTSNYQSPVNLFQSADITFKFALNQRDNEMSPGVDHQFTVEPVNGKAETPLIKFGTQLKLAKASGKFLSPNTGLKIKLDMREVMTAFKKDGYYTTFKGDKIYKDDFKGVFVAGPTSPMTWDFDNLHNTPQLKLQDEDGDGIYETTLILNKTSEVKATDTDWKLSKDISPYPQYFTDATLPNAIYNLSLEEMLKAVEPDSTFRTGKEWSGVWTRDISYSIILSMAYLQPRVAMNSLLKKVNAKKRIIQDTGTGGAWPVSSDRTIWSVAAWEIYKATGDKDWLKLAYEIIRNTMEDDLKNSFDKETGLFRGESSFLDWREQTYPKWMQPADIFESINLGTNAAFFQANTVLAEMAILLKDNAAAAKFKAVAEGVKKGINKYLWMPEKGYYAQYLYGREYKIVSPRSEALGEALCIVFGIADAAKAKRMVASVPLTEYGITCIYPQIPNIPPYHNNAIWPFVQSYWLWACAKAGNEKAVLESISDIYRPAALFLTNKENMVADNGDFNGTQINSSVMLWSLSGNLSIVHKVLFGIHFNATDISFAPFVPASMAGKRSLKNFRYRNAILNIEMEGFGNKIKSFTIDGKPGLKYSVAENLTGTHTIKIVLANNALSGNINKTANYTTLPAPEIQYQNNAITWNTVEKAVGYKLYRNGKLFGTYKQPEPVPAITNQFSSYCVVAVDEKNVPSFTSEPLMITGNDLQQIEMETIAGKAGYNYKGFSGNGFSEISTTLNRSINIPVTAPADGYYSLSFRYANGNGPTNTENKCAIRTIKTNGEVNGIVVFPQRGKNEWSNWGMSNGEKVYLKKGANTITLSYEDHNANMNGEVNQAMLDYIKISRL